MKILFFLALSAALLAQRLEFVSPPLDSSLDLFSDRAVRGRVINLDLIICDDPELFHQERRYISSPAGFLFVWTPICRQS